MNVFATSKKSIVERIVRRITKSECKQSVFGHSWQKRGWLNSRFYHHGALSRTGEMCYHCAKVRFPETDQEYYDQLPTWLKKDPELQVPSSVVRV